MRLSSQDIEALRYLHAVKVATYKQIHRDIYPEKALKTVYNRVALLAKQNLVTGIYDRLGLPADKVLSLSKRGFNRFVATGDERRLELRSDAVLHDLSLVDLRSKVMGWSKVQDYYTENTIQTWWTGSVETHKDAIAKMRSDGIARMLFPKGEIWVAVEYESADKMNSRYDRILRNYYRSLEISLLLYVCETTRLVNKLHAADRKVYTEQYPKTFYALKQDILTTDTALFTNRDGKQLRFAPHTPRESLENSSGIFPASNP